eukprot:5512956-Pyramimonas_sp.AAC.2
MCTECHEIWWAPANRDKSKHGLYGAATLPTNPTREEMHRKTTPSVSSLMLVRLPSEGVSPEEIRSLRETSEGYTLNPVYVALNGTFKFGQPGAPRTVSEDDILTEVRAKCAAYAAGDLPPDAPPIWKALGANMLRTIEGYVGKPYILLNLLNRWIENGLLPPASAMVRNAHKNPGKNKTRSPYWVYDPSADKQPAAATRPPTEEAVRQPAAATRPPEEEVRQSYAEVVRGVTTGWRPWRPCAYRCGKTWR